MKLLHKKVCGRLGGGVCDVDLVIGLPKWGFLVS